MDLSAMYGDMEMVRFLHQNRTEGCTANAMDYAAFNGQLDIVKFLRCTTKAMNHAAAKGFLDINRTEGCTKDAMDNAAENGYLQ
ncbi:hypothetical protein THRCLA_21613 [Thraustotheca clavata]|uniref:Uncharacterized protein n=1 Tax=Thraustotheca clavata TaxID=74557 RepID=A0A1V9ZV03_9STRA|nr:hypothetical protein THRCLA_21613 [Thraustotheca clavata]